MSSSNFCAFPTSIYGMEHETFLPEDLAEDIELEDDVQRPKPLGNYTINPRKRVSGGPVFQTLEGIPGVKCPNCASKGQTVWVIRGRACEVCKTPVLG